MNPLLYLIDILPPSVRKYLYGAYALAGLILGGLNVAHVHTGVASDVLAYVGVALGTLAAANTAIPPLPGYEVPLEPVLPPEPVIAEPLVLGDVTPEALAPEPVLPPEPVAPVAGEPVAPAPAPLAAPPAPAEVIAPAPPAVPPTA